MLSTFHAERSHIAHQLIDFDANFAKHFGPQADMSSPAFFDTWKNAQGFTSGCGQQYLPSTLVVPDNDPPSFIDRAALEPLTPGKRLLPMTLTRHLDGWPVSSLDDMPANGQFYEVLFAGDISAEPRAGALRDAYARLTSSRSALSRYNRHMPTTDLSNNNINNDSAEDRDRGVGAWDFEDIHTSSPRNEGKIIDLFVVHTADHLRIDLRPEFETWKYRFYEDKDGVEHARHGVDAAADGQMVVALVRPDGIVGMVCTADEMLDRVPAYFEGFVK